MTTLRSAAIMLAVSLVLGGCATTAPYDYSALRQHPPRSILVLPPLNQSTAVEATCSYLSTVTRPIAELGYYVFPVAVVDQFFKENGMPTAGEMHQVPLDKVVKLMGADAVLYPTVLEYGSKYQLVSTVTTVSVVARLVDARTGTLLWQGSGLARQDTNGSGNFVADLIAAAVVQAINTTGDAAHIVSQRANEQLFHAPGRRLPYGPYRPQYAREP